MKYKSIDELNTFDFHDAVIENFILSEKEMTFEISELNATTANSQNSDKNDLCIEKAIMTLQNAEVTDLEFLAYKEINNQGIILKDEPAKKADKEQFSEILQNTLIDCKSYFQSVESLKKENDKYTACFCIDGNFNTYFLTVKFDSAIVSWDVFSDVAWYVKLSDEPKN